MRNARFHLGFFLSCIVLQCTDNFPPVHAAARAATDHQHFDATIVVPFLPPPGKAARRFMLQFEYPSLARPQSLMWRVELLGKAGRVIRRWNGITSLHTEEMLVPLHWDGLDALGLPIPDERATLTLAVVAVDADRAGQAEGSLEAFVDAALVATQGERIDQAWDLQIGPQVTPPLQATPPTTPQQGRTGRVAGTTLPFRVYYGNLHSQTNHSDGGGPLATCHGAQEPLAAPYGPAEAFQFALGRGLDFLMASEHNHLFDGSDGSNPDGSPEKARALYQSGLSAAVSFNASHAGFLALYGMEWGVIQGGGHMNIFGSQELYGWERDRNGQLFADRYSPKGDYAGLYQLMRQQGLSGQFNHPARTGQFLVGGTPFGWTADADEVMALCEVMNTSAFSNRDDESETRHSSYETACQSALEAGFHVAFSSDQDNHCANWGASYTNRTAVLLREDQELNTNNFMEAIRARRVFATMDKYAQMVLTANGHIMGERFTNSNALQLDVHYSHAGNRQVAMVQMIEGVPKRNGNVTVLSDKASVRITPSTGAHFYYARLTQDDGKILWSAPIWVDQVEPSRATRRRHRR